MDSSEVERRSRIRQLADVLQGMVERAWGPDVDGVDPALIKRFTPEQLSSYQASISREAAESASLAAAGVTTANTNSRVGANPATKGTTIATGLSTVANTFTQTVVLPSAASSSLVASSSAVRTTSAASVAPVSSVVVASSRSSSPTPVLTITSTPASSSSSSRAASSTTEALPSAVAANASTSESSGLSTGAIVGIVLGGLIGVVVAGSMLGWLYRKFSNRGYGASSSWRKMGGNGEDDDITPFNDHEKMNGGRYTDDFYGGGASAAPVIGSRRALAMARSNFDHDGSYRPQSEYYNNQAGVGTAARDYGAYSSAAAGYAGGVDAQGRPYNPHAGRVPMSPAYQDHMGPGAYPDVNTEIMPVPLGRPAPPSSHADLMSHEDFADDPLSATTTTAAGAGSYAYQTRHGAAPQGVHQSPGSASVLSGPPSYGGHTPPQPNAYSPPGQTSGLPPINPVSPLGSAFTFNRAYGQSQAGAAHQAMQQKALYGEVARAAGVHEPIPPVTPDYALGHSTSSNATSSFMTANLSNSTSSSFSAGAGEARLPPPPALTVSAPQPYQHGQPLSPLIEVSTPGSMQSAGAAAAANPFERLPVPAPNQRVLVAPHSAASSTGATAFPSPAYPPPSPGGMSVPGSITDSPRRWSGNAPGAQVGRGVSLYSGDDAYGGI